MFGVRKVVFRHHRHLLYLPSSGECEIIHSISVVLRSDVAIPREVVDHRLVLTTVTKRELFCLCTRGESKQLIAQTNTKNGLQQIRRGINDLIGGLLIWLLRYLIVRFVVWL